MKKYLIIAFILFQASFCFGQTAKEKAILQLLEVTNSKAQVEQTWDLLIPQFMELFPSVPNSFWALLKQNMDIEGLVKELIPLYDRHYTLQDIQGLIKFYKSPLGKKMIAVTPKLTAEAMAVGQEWGKKIAEKIVESLRAGGYLDA